MRTAIPSCERSGASPGASMSELRLVARRTRRQRRCAGRTRRSDAEHSKHKTLSGIAFMRPRVIDRPHTSQMPYVPSSSFVSARSMRSTPRSSDLPTPISVNRLTASEVPSPIRFPKLTALPSSGRWASTPRRSRLRSRRAVSSARTASRSRSSSGATYLPYPRKLPCRRRGAEQVRGRLCGGQRTQS
jgi:hypothetical protein